MFHKEFYPTPSSVLDMMGLNVKGKAVLEPQAGKADIVKYCWLNGAESVFTYEINDDLREILKPVSRVLGSDFLMATAEDIAHIDIIVMNPPFSTAIKHILHAWEIAPEGCEIISLCNFESINGYEQRLNGFARILSDYGDSENLGSCFDTAERKTNCSIGLIRLFKPVVSTDFDFSAYFTEEEDEPNGSQKSGLMPFNEVRAVVNSYVSAVREYKRLDEVKDYLNSITKNFGFSKIELSKGSGTATFNSLRDFSITLQKQAWQHFSDKRTKFCGVYR